MTYLLFVAGIALLIKGAQFLVEGSSSIAKHFGIPTIIIGLTVVAFGTSTPEFFIALLSALRGTTDIALGNVVGANLLNILVILGASALVYPLRISRHTVWKEIPFSLLAALVLLIIANGSVLGGTGAFSLSRVDGLLLLLFFAIFFYYTLELARSQRSRMKLKDIGIEHRSVLASLGLTILGIAFLWLGGEWVVRGAVHIAQGLGASTYLIAATVVSIGTTLPELVTSLTAALKKSPGLAVGNAVGSTIFNVFWILGIASIIRPIPIPLSVNTDIMFLVFATLLLFVFMFIGHPKRLDRWQGLLFVALYLVYLTFVIMRG